MDASTLAREAYGAKTSQSLRDPRALEYSVFAKISNRLRTAAEGTNGMSPAAISAVHDNRRLWTFIAASVADETNALAPELRASLFHLAQCVDHASQKTLRGQEQFETLLEINAAVLQGLGTSGQKE